MDPKQAIQIGTEIFLEPSGNLSPDSKDYRNPVSLSYMKKKGEICGSRGYKQPFHNYSKSWPYFNTEQVNKTDKDAFGFSLYFFF